MLPGDRRCRTETQGHKGPERWDLVLQRVMGVRGTLAATSSSHSVHAGALPCSRPAAMQQSSCADGCAGHAGSVQVMQAARSQGGINLVHERVPAALRRAMSRLWNQAVTLDGHLAGALGGSGCHLHSRRAVGWTHSQATLLSVLCVGSSCRSASQEQVNKA